MRRTAAAIGTVAVVGLLAVGCGSSSSDDAKKDDSTTTTTAAAPMTKAQLTEKLLTPAELGTGWTADTSSSGGSSSTPSCLKAVEGAGTSVADTEASFANGQTVFAYEGLGAQASESAAETSYSAVTTALDGCQDVSITSGGQTISGTITPNGNAGVGTASKSYTMQFTAEGIPVGIDVVVAYVGDVDMVVMYGTLGQAQPGAVGTMAEKAIEKISSGQAA